MGPSRGQSTARSRDDFLTLLAENLEFLSRSAASFDEGYEAEAKRLAVVLRVLLYDTRQAHSLLCQLGVKNLLGFRDTAAPISPTNLLPTPGLVSMRMTMTETGPQSKYVAPLDMDRPHGSRIVTFDRWWESPVMKVDGTWSRQDLVKILANKEGGAHVDPRLDERYAQLARHNGLGWTASYEGGKASGFEGDVVAAAVRQISYEVAETLSREEHLLR